MLKAGTYRFDIIVLVGYQMLHFFSIQQLFTIFFDYAPKTTCIDNFCFKVEKKCTMECIGCENLCGNLTESELGFCVNKYHAPFYRSAAMEYGSYCKTPWKHFSAISTQYLGVLVGSAVLGFVADKIGRKGTIIASLIIGIICLICSGTLDGLMYFYIFRLISGIAIAGTMSVGWAYCSEIISTKHRFKLRTFSNWANARLMMTFVAFVTGEWRLSTYVYAGIACITLCLFMILPESPMWLKRKNKFERVEKARMRIARINGLEFEPESYESIDSDRPPEIGIGGVFKDPELRKNILILWVMWLSGGLNMYLTDLNGGDMTPNFWHGQFLVCVTLSTAKIILGFADMKFMWLGRRTIFISCLSIAMAAFVCIIVLLYTDHKGDWYYLAIYLTATVFLNLTWEPCYLCVSELMPTEVRATASASCNFITRCGSLLASTLLFLKGVHEPAIFFIILGSSAISMTIVGSLLKETKNCELEKVGASTQAKADLEASSTETSPVSEPGSGKEKSSKETITTDSWNTMMKSK